MTRRLLPAPGERTAGRTRLRASAPAAQLALKVRSKVWIESAGQVVLSNWRIGLLEEIDRTGSLAEAAQALGVPYRTAWYKLRDAEAALGTTLVVRQSGGRRGGSSRLTPAAGDLIRRFRAVTDDLDRLVRERFAIEFGNEAD